MVGPRESRVSDPTTLSTDRVKVDDHHLLLINETLNSEYYCIIDIDSLAACNGECGVSARAVAVATGNNHRHPCTQ